jgi:glycine reductase complex component B subunit gamma
MRVVHYLNQFYGRLGGEEAAATAVRLTDGAVGPGVRLNELLAASNAAIVATLVCGDNFPSEQPETFSTAVRQAFEALHPDVVVAGPAFNAGRYGLACARVCEIALQMGIPSVTAMHVENPAVSLHRRDLVIVPTTATASGMQIALGTLARLAVHLAKGEPLGPPWDDGYLPHGLRRVELRDAPAAERALNMLAARLRGESIQTEIPLPEITRVEPAAPVADLTTARLAIVSTSALVPHGNPDKLRQSYSTDWRQYSLDGLSALEPGEWESIHGGYDTSAANGNPHLVVPLDALRALEGSAFGQLHPAYFVTAGVGTPVSAAQRMGGEIAAELLKSGVQGVILTAT